MIFSVRPGASTREVADDLRKAGLILSTAYFRSLAEASGLDKQVQSGNYDLRQTMSAREILDALAYGTTRKPDLVTIAEGWRAEEVALVLESRGVVSSAAFMRAVAGEGTGLQLPARASSFEGYLFPDSYEFAPGSTAEQVLERMTRHFSEKVGPALLDEVAAHSMRLDQIVTIASIIEREAVVPSDRFLISEVLYNRLSNGMTLDIDATVQYALVPFGAPSPPGGFWKTQLTAAELDIRSPYNTYSNHGLPPGPICSPGLASIEAAANPAVGPLLYFVARDNGSHLFATNLEDHVRNVAFVRSR